MKKYLPCSFPENKFEKCLFFSSLILFNIFIFLPVVSISQVNDFGRTYSDTIPEKFYLDITQLKNQIYSNIPAYQKKGEFEKMTYRFADQEAYRASSLLSSGQVYSDWMPLENYINDILKKVTPPELKSDTTIHAYLIRNGTYNAFMTASGKTFINIGMFAYISDESELAGILAHELAHYYLKHSLQMFIETEQGTFDGGGFFFKNKKESRYSIRCELQADSLAMRWTNKSGYAVEGLIYAFKTMYRLERHRLKLSKEDWEIKETTHPLSAKRLEILNDYYKENSSTPGTRFLVDENKFYKFKEETKPEILKYLLNNFHYSDCIEKAFQFHIFDPDNSLYVYYLMEGIRRNCYMDIDIWNKNFITARYFDSLNADGRRYKERMEDDLFKTFDLDILTIDPRDGVKIKAKFYWRGEPKFKTYEQAFNFFYKVSKGLNNHECILSNALSYTHDSTARNKFIREYLSYNDIKHKEYAENLLTGTNIKKLNKQEMIVFNQFQTVIKQGKENNYLEVSASRNELSEFFDSVMAGRKNQTHLYLPSIKKYKNNEYTILSELEDFSMMITLSKGEKTELHILNPIFWETFKKYNVNKIEFVNCIYTEEHGKDNTIDGYRILAKRDFNTLFNQKGCTRNFEIYITGLREIENVSMKTKYHGGAKELKIKIPNREQMLFNMKYELTDNEIKTKEKDYYNPQ